MSDRREEILHRELQPTGLDCQTIEEDIKMSLVLNPSVDKIKNAMDEYFKERALDLLDYLASKQAECRMDKDGSKFLVKAEINWEHLTKEQLFENFL